MHVFNQLKEYLEKMENICEGSIEEKDIDVLKTNLSDIHKLTLICHNQVDLVSRKIKNYLKERG